MKQVKYEELSEQVQELIDNDTHQKEVSSEEHLNGMTTIQYEGKVSTVKKTYTYDIDWMGYDNGEDGGVWGEPYNIRVEEV